MSRQRAERSTLLADDKERLMINFDTDFPCWYFTRAISPLYLPSSTRHFLLVILAVCLSIFCLQWTQRPSLGRYSGQCSLLGDSQPRDDPHRTRQKGLLAASAPFKQRRPAASRSTAPTLPRHLKTLVHKQLCVICAKAQLAVLLFLPQSRRFAWCKVSSDYNTRKLPRCPSNRPLPL